MKREIKKVQDGLVQWTVGDERWYYVEAEDQWYPSVTWVLNSYPKGKGYQDWRDKLGGEAADEMRDEAGRKGGRVHNAIAAMIYNHMTGKAFAIRHNDVFPDNEGQLKELNAEEYQAIISFAEWWKETDPIPVAFETVCVSESEGYAGTIDFVCEIAGERWVLDFKTSKSVQTTHELQVAAYVNTPQALGATRAAILQVGYGKNKRGWKFTEVEDLSDKYQVFLATKRIWWHENKNVTPKGYEFPEFVQLENLTEQLTESIKHERTKRNGSQPSK